MVQIGIKPVSSNPHQTQEIQTKYYTEDTSDIVMKSADGESETTLIIGHNIKFDLHWLRRVCKTIDEITFEDFLATQKVWDTQLAEYILSGQNKLYPSLDYCSEKYGGTIKDDRIKAFWQAGIDTPDIPEEMLTEYLKYDVDNTHKVFLGQLEEAKKKGMLPLIRSMNEALLGYQEMEWNGMAVDMDVLEYNKAVLQRELSGVEYGIDQYILPEHMAYIDLGSPKQLSAFLFGGEIKYKIKELVGKYKNGNDKYKLIEHVIERPGFDLDPEEEWETKNAGVYKTSDEILKAIIADHHPTDNVTKFCKLIQQKRAMSKELSAYYESIPNLIHDDGFLHQNINHTATHTGRLSQNEPNLQNVSTGSKSKVKTMFVSRWGDEGVILEADYKQLEVIALAFLSGDRQLIDDLKHGRDMHDETFNKVAHLLPSHLTDKEKRRVVKSVNFGLVYGGGAKTLGKNAGIPTSLAKTIIDAFFDRYPGVKEWNKDVMTKVKMSRVLDKTKTPKGRPRGRGVYKSLTGREYVFLENDSFPWLIAATGKLTSFTPTQTNNYPVQGFATGDVVPTVIGKLFRALKEDPILRDKCLMINTVHDSIIFDVHEDVLGGAIAMIQEIMEDAPQILKEVYGFKFDLPLKVDITYGPNWKDQGD